MRLRAFFLLIPFWMAIPSADASIVTAPGDYQIHAGCAVNWDPVCLATELTDQGAGNFALTVTTLPAGNYEFKITLDQSWATNYGLNGVPAGSNVPFVVPADLTPVTFTWNSATHIPEVTVGGAPVPEPSTFALAALALAAGIRARAAKRRISRSRAE